MCNCMLLYRHWKQTAEHWLSQVGKMFLSVLDVQHEWVKIDPGNDDG